MNKNKLLFMIVHKIIYFIFWLKIYYFGNEKTPKIIKYYFVIFGGSQTHIWSYQIMNSMTIGIIVVSIAMAPPWTPSPYFISCDDHHLHHPCEEPPWKYTKLVHLIANEWIIWEIKHHNQHAVRYKIIE